MALSRSENMSRIRSANTAPELIVRRALHHAGLRYRLQVRTPGGKADLVVPARKFALFIDGCFWHGCPEHYVHPRSNGEFWDKKLRENVDRDRRQTRALSAEGWTVVRVWEHEVHEAPLKVVELVQKRLSGKRRVTAGWRVVRVQSTEGAIERRSHEDLLDEGKQQEVVRERTTAKTGRVRAGAVRGMSGPVGKGSGGGEHHGRKSGRDDEA
ncbi:MAG: very short patch repair endonuclease [Archangium sp.]|nr:very short patch repair endonuclease [Archangium sp.]MDP3570695.1 very short patch repair endonuclease [Archangium sp.]